MMEATQLVGGFEEEFADSPENILWRLLAWGPNTPTSYGERYVEKGVHPHR